MDDSVRVLLREQDDVIARRQALRLGLTSEDIRRLLRRNDWATAHPGVYVAHTGPLLWPQRAWAAVLHAGSGAALCHVSALRAADGPGRADRPEDILHVAIDRSRRVVAPEGVQIHRTVDLETRVLWNLGPPRMRYDQAALDVALNEATKFGALGVMPAACQSRRTTPYDGAASRGCPRRQEQGSTPGLAARGAHRCRRRDLLRAGAWLPDPRRAPARPARRLSYGQVFDRPCSTAGKIGQLLAARGWRGELRCCGPQCRLS